MTFKRSDALAPIVVPAALWLREATVREHDPALDAPIAASVAQVLAHPPEETSDVRTMYKRVGLDPTRTRPSSEALLRRVRRGDPFPRINSMVDVCNWCSLEFQLPYGLYDADRITGDVVLRIRKDEVHVGGRITLADAEGPFGNPTSDSARTMVTTATTSALLVVFAPVPYALARLRDVVDVTSARMHQFTGARELARQLEFGPRVTTGDR
jgi:DNA/RNA-binding domain of Phe-tRNA-synthetase-like protein